LQNSLPLNPEGFGAAPWNVSFNTASSFVTNTNWQYYAGETTLEGKDVRFGTGASALWATVTTVTSCGAVNAAMESLSGLGGAIPMSNMMTGEVIFGGVGSGLYPC
jgi:K+-transporting ATPase A subunit